MNLYRTKQGFTLIELLIAVAIVGILVTIVYPSYVDVVNSNNRAEAKRELVRIANLQEQYFNDMRSYTNDMKKLGLSADPYITDSTLYSIDATVDGTSFKLTATAKGSQATNDSDCLKLEINELGEKTATNSFCWDS